MKNLQYSGALLVIMLFHISNVVAFGDTIIELPRIASVEDTLLEHYSNTADSLQRKAVNFLVDNLEGHGFVTYELRDTTGQSVTYNVLDYPDFATLEINFDSLESVYGVLDFEKKDFIKDDSIITADFLIQHIDLAFEAWQNRPWAGELTFDQFCEYVLPYRGSNEPLEEWRHQLYHQYDSLVSLMNDLRDPIEAAALINKDLMTWFHFDPRFYYHPTDQSLSDMRATKIGRCEDMTNLCIFAMRANGLAVTSDYTPYWANTGNNHAWNAIVKPSGEVIPFMGAEANPGEYKLANRLAKVYRKTYSIQSNNLAFQVEDPDKLPGYLASKSYIDVTKDYVPVSDVRISLSNIPENEQFAYLCVFNSGEWRPIQWGRIEGEAVIFEDMGMNIAYLPGYYVEQEIVPAGLPFILNDEAQVIELNPNLSETISVSLNSTTRVSQVESTDGISHTNLTAGQNYELSYWSKGWQLIETKAGGNDALQFEDVPAGALYWLTAMDSNKEERIFTYALGRQVWW